MSISAKLNTSDLPLFYTLIPNKPVANKPLIISFSFQSWNSPPSDYLKNELSTLEASNQTTYNKLFLHDSSNAWYTNGFDGYDDLQSSVTALADFCQQLSPSSIHFIGESMGAFGALLIASQLSKRHTEINLNSLVALSPISFFSTVRAEQYGDNRYKNSMKTAKQDTPCDTNDIAFMTSLSNDTKVSIIYGGKPPEHHLEATTFDAMHAWRIKHYLPHAHIMTYPECGIHISKDLRNTQKLLPLLQTQLL